MYIDAWLVGSQGLQDFEIGSKDAWLTRSQDPTWPVFSLIVAKSLRGSLACLPWGKQAPVSSVLEGPTRDIWYQSLGAKG